jgi:hypothetical protein
MMRSILRSVPFVAGLVIACGVGAATFGLSQTLLKPRAELKVAADALGELNSSDYVVSRVHMGGSLFRARCRPLAHRDSLVTLAGGARLLVTRTQVLRSGGALGPSKARAIADLAGCPLVLGRLLATRVETAFARGGFVPLVRHGRYYWIPLTRRKPLVVLEVSRASLEPVGVLFRGRILRGVASIREIQPRRRIA